MSRQLKSKTESAAPSAVVPVPATRWHEPPDGCVLHFQAGLPATRVDETV